MSPRGRRPGIAGQLPTPLVRAVLDAGVDLYPANDQARQRRLDALVAGIERHRQARRDAQGRVARGGAR